MRMPKYSNDIFKYATVPQACDYFKLGRNSLMKYLDNTGAIKRFGKSVRIDIPKATEILDSYEAY